MADQQVTRGVLRGCAVAAEGTPSMNVAVAAGAILYDNLPVTVAAVATLAITAADATLPRWTAVVVDSAGTVTAADGTPTAPDSNGVVPSPVDDGTKITLARVFVDAAVTTIVSSAVTDQRTYALIQTSPYQVSGLWYGPPATGAVSNVNWNDNDMFLLPFFTAKTLSINAIGVGQAAHGTAGNKGRLGIYSDDGAGTLALLVDAGQVSLSSAGADGSVVSASTSQTFTPGWWWLALAFQSMGGTKPTLAIANPSGVSPIGAGDGWFDNFGTGGGIRYAGVSGALPSTPTSPDYGWAYPYPGVWVKTA